MDLSTPLIVSWLILFAHIALMPGMVGDAMGLRKALQSAPDAIHKPLFDCYTCMSPWWGVPVTGVVLLCGMDGPFLQVYLASVAISTITDAVLQRL